MKTGAIEYPNGCYEGEVIEDCYGVLVPHGKGKFTTRGGIVHEGIWAESCINKEGIIYPYEVGYEGLFVSDQCLDVTRESGDLASGSGTTQRIDLGYCVDYESDSGVATRRSGGDTPPSSVIISSPEIKHEVDSKLQALLDQDVLDLGDAREDNSGSSRAGRSGGFVARFGTDTPSPPNTYRA